MRCVHNKERIQRGCQFCVDYRNEDLAGKKFKQRMCIYEKCPYHELDGFKKYRDYLKSIGADTMTEVLRSLGLGIL